jgi:hypothetical protein
MHVRERILKTDSWEETLRAVRPLRSNIHFHIERTPTEKVSRQRTGRVSKECRTGIALHTQYALQ